MPAFSSLPELLKRLIIGLLFISWVACQRSSPATNVTVPLPDCSEADTLRQHGIDRYNAGDYAAAKILAGQAAEIALVQCKDTLRWAKARTDLARCVRRADPIYGPDSAIALLQTDLKFVEPSRMDLAGKFHFEIAYAYLSQEKYWQALPHYEQARLILEEFHQSVVPNPRLYLYVPLANIYIRLGESEKGIALLHLSLDSCQRKKDFTSVATIRNNLGLAFADQGNTEEACAQYAMGWHSSQTYPATDSSHVRTELAGNWAAALLELGRRDSADLFAHLALKVDPDNPNAMLIISRLAWMDGKLAVADSLAEVACKLLDFGDPISRELGKALLWRAELHATAHPARALAYCQQALSFVLPGFTGSNPSPHNFYPENTILEALDLKSRLLWQAYQRQPNALALQAADTTTALALQMADTLSAAYGFESSQLASLANTRNLHERYLQILFEQYHRSDDSAVLARIVAFSEKSRAILLRQKLAGQQALVAGSASDSLAQRERVLREALIEEKNELAFLEADGATPTELEAQRQKIFGLDDQRNQLLQRLRATAPLYVNRQYGHASATLSDIQSALPDDSTLLVEYFYNPESGALYELGITRTSVRLHRNHLPIRDLEDFQVLVRNAAYGLASEGNPDFVRQYAEMAGALYDTLLRPLSGNRPPAALIVVPDGMLGALPYDALLTEKPDTTRATFRQLPYLLRSTRVRLAPSATVLLAARERLSAAACRGYLGVAAAYPAGGFFPPVQHGEDCVNQLADRFDSRPLTGQSASKMQFRAMAPRCQILHFYGHGKANNESPERSFVAFTPTQQPAVQPAPEEPAAALPPDNAQTLSARSGLPPELVPDVMFAQEISLLDLPAELVVLSACETGVGPAVGGEGIFSLARAFQEAGCPSVAMTLWEVNDAATADITTNFLEGVRQGLNKDEALRRAKLQQLDNGRSAIPYFWSCFVLTGNADPVHLAGGGTGEGNQPVSGRMLLAMIALLLLIFGLLGLIFRRQ